MTSIITIHSKILLALLVVIGLEHAVGWQLPYCSRVCDVKFKHFSNDWSTKAPHSYFEELKFKFADGSKLALTPYGECCSGSTLFLKKHHPLDFRKLLGSKIEYIDEDGGYEGNVLDEEYDVIFDHRYVLGFSKGDTKHELDIFLRHSSNGYYTGYMEETWSCLPTTRVSEDERGVEVIFLVGLPGAGKTTWLSANAKSDETTAVYDDNCLGLLNEVGSTINNSNSVKKIYLATPMFCKKRILQNTVRTIKKCAGEGVHVMISMVLFRKNTPLSLSRKPDLATDIATLGAKFMDFPEFYKNICPEERITVVGDLPMQRRFKMRKAEPSAEEIPVTKK